MRRAAWVIAPPTKHCAFAGLFSVGLRLRNPLILPVSTDPAALPDRKNPRRSGFSATFSRWSNKKPHKVSLLPKQGEVLLENNVVNDCVFAADICKSCKIILIDYSDKEGVLLA
jgi:hypothetical protein